MGLIIKFSDIEEALKERVVEFSKELMCPYSSISVRIFQSQETGQIVFVLYKKDTEGDNMVRELKFMKDIMKVRFDALGWKLQIDQFLPLLLDHFAQKIPCSYGDVRVIAIPRSDEDSSVAFALYKQTHFIEWIDPASIEF